MNELETIQAAQIQKLELALVKLISELWVKGAISDTMAEQLGDLLKGD